MTGMKQFKNWYLFFLVYYIIYLKNIYYDVLLQQYTKKKNVYCLN